MALIPALPEDFEQAQRDLRAEIRAPRTEARNVAIAAETEAPSFFTYRGTGYKVPPLPYQLGVQLQEIQLTIRNLAEDEEAGKNANDNDRVMYTERLLDCYERAIDFFWQACYPLAFWKRFRFKRVNPFLTASTTEIGDLLGFFFMCRTRSSVTIQGSLATRPSLMLSTRQMT